MVLLWSDPLPGFPEWSSICLESNDDTPLPIFSNNYRFGFRTFRAVKGIAALIPIWSAGMVAFALAVVPWLRLSKRFSLRTLLITTTLVAVVLGFAVYAARK
jgi:hypothetical protein